MTYIFDACAIFALFKCEEGIEKVKSLIEKASAEQADIYMNIINLLEVHYSYYRDFGPDKAANILERIYRMPIHFVDTIDADIFSEASRLKAQYAIPLGDAIGLATAIKMKGTFVTADYSDFSEIEQAESIPFFWFRENFSCSFPYPHSPILL